MEWLPDILGDDFEACTVPAAGPDGVERTATLVRHVPGAGSAAGAGVAVAGSAGAGVAGGRRPRAVLFLHGWSDYFFNEELAEFWAGQGFAFFALDMHNQVGHIAAVPAGLEAPPVVAGESSAEPASPAPPGHPWSQALGGATGSTHWWPSCARTAPGRWRSDAT